MAQPKIFIDTRILIEALTKTNKFSEFIFWLKGTEKYTNEYALKETRRVLKEKYKYTVSEINKFIEVIRENCKVLPAPAKEEFSKIIARDKSDRPIIYSAKREKCVLIMRNKFVLRDAKKYVETRTPEEFFEEYIEK